MSSCPSMFLVWLVVLTALRTSTELDGCSVTPSAAAVVAGGNLSLTCATENNQGLIDSWRFGSDTAGSLRLYQGPIYYMNGSVRVERKVADGYMANDSIDGQVVLTIITASTDQADFYYCICTGSSGVAYVSVLASEPTFSNATEIIDGEPVVFICSVSFSGLANVSVTIKDSFGSNLNTSRYPVTSKGLYVFDLEYSTTANSSTFQAYSCNIILTNDTSKTMIYSGRVDFAVPWVSVQNAQINPTNVTRCKHNNQCSINQTIRCTAEGNPKPVTFQWLASINGSGFTMNETGGDHFTFETVGDYAVQCIAFNLFNGKRYSSSSDIFKTQVLVNGPVYGPAGGSQSGDTAKTSVIVGVGVGVGVGGFIIIVLAIVLFLYCKRKKNRTGCFNHEDEGTKNIESMQLSKNGASSKSNNSDNINGTKTTAHTTGMQNKGFDKDLSDETIVVENDLYSGKPPSVPIDPSDGGYASLNEVQPHKR